MIDQGVSDARAASVARNITVNFNRKGELSNGMNAWFMFFNASVQGVNQVWRTMSNKNTWPALGVLMTLGFSQAWLNRLLMGKDEEDDKWWYDKIDPSMRRSKWILGNPWGDRDGEFFQFSLPYGYNFFKNIGDSVYQAVVEGRPNQEILSNTLLAIDEGFNPVSSGTPLQMILPTVADPFAMIWENKTFFGGKVGPTRFPGDTSPDSELFFRSVSPISKEAMRQLNQFAGGSKFRPPRGELLQIFDISPETVDLFASQYSGGLGRTLSDLGGTAMTLFNHNVFESLGKRFEDGDIPFVRLFVRKVSDFPVRDEYYTNSTTVNQAKKELKALQEEDQKKASKFRSDNAVIFRAAPRLKRIRKILSRMNKKRKKLLKELDKHTNVITATLPGVASKKARELQKEIEVVEDKMILEMKANNKIIRNEIGKLEIK